MVTSASNAAISHTGKRDRAMTGADALVGAGLDFVSGRRIRLPPNYQEGGNFGTPILKLEQRCFDKVGRAAISTFAFLR
jgi:hypothetical protein